MINIGVCIVRTSFCNLKTLVLCMALLLTACHNLEKSEISTLLEARDKAVSQQDITSFSSLLSANYNDNNHSKIDVVAQMIHLFNTFDNISMQSHDRVIRILDDAHAQCEQSYTLKVFADNTWRNIVQKEQLQLIREKTGWKISAGL